MAVNAMWESEEAKEGMMEGSEVFVYKVCGANFERHPPEDSRLRPCRNCSLRYANIDRE